MSATATESKQFGNIAATTAAFGLKGGRYGLVVSANFGAGNVQLQMLSLDGVTWINFGAPITAASVVTNDLPPGQYRLAVTAPATAVYASLTSVPV
jgi:hypothetical protein